MYAKEYIKELEMEIGELTSLLHMHKDKTFATNNPQLWYIKLNEWKLKRKELMKKLRKIKRDLK